MVVGHKCLQMMKERLNLLYDGPHPIGVAIFAYCSDGAATDFHGGYSRNMDLDICSETHGLGNANEG